jgi:hypothetical protein
MKRCLMTICFAILAVSAALAQDKKTVPPPPKPAVPAPARPAVQPSPSNQQRPANTPQPGQPSQPVSTPNPSSNGSAPRTYSPKANPPTVYTPHSSSNSTGASGSGSSIYKPSTSGPTVYTPHSSASSSTGVRSSGSTTYKPSTSGPTVYTPHAASSDASTPNSVAGPSHVNGAAVYTPRSATTSGAAPSSHTNSVPSSTTGSVTSVRAKASVPIHAAYTPPPATGIASKTSTDASVLTQAASQKVISQVNTARASMSGVNKRPLPTGQVTVQPSGHLTLAASGNRLYSLRPNGTLASFSGVRGLSANFAANGRLRSVQTANMKIQYGPRGGRTAIKQLPNHSTLVSYGRHSGYLELSVVRNNVTLVQRTYVGRDATYVRMYSPYSYRGVGLLAYEPGVYYAPAFYGWGYYPWDAPVPYAWGWAGDPWFGSYGSYFAPMPAYASATLWMTDYILGSTLAAAYQQQQDFSAPIDSSTDGEDAAPAEDGSSQGEVYAQTSTPITQELKGEIAEEVREELAAENAVANNQAPADVQELSSDLQPNHVFVVASLLDVSSDQGNCSLTGGDIITLVDPTGSDSQTAVLGVASSKRADCPAGAKVQVALQDLQDMDNNLRAQMDGALAKLHSNQGRGGLPAAPKSALAPPPRPVIGDDMPAAEQDVRSMLAAEEQEAAKEETQINQEAFAGSPSEH